MSKNIEEVFKEILSVLQVVKLYTAGHPMFAESLSGAYADLSEILKEKGGFVIGIIGDEVAFEKEIFFELSKIAAPAILYLKERGVERIMFLRDLSENELGEFIKFLAAPKGETAADPQEYLYLKGVKNIIVGKVGLTAPVAIEGKVRLDTAVGIYEGILFTVSKAVNAILDGQPLEQLSIKSTMHSAVEGLANNYQEFLKLVSVKRYSEETFIHLLNVSVLSMYFSSKLGFNKEDVLDIAVAALFHDIGKLYVSRKVLGKDARLTDEEFGRIKSHTVLGAEFMLRYSDKLGFLPAVVCFEHHLKYDLSGYPKLLYPVRPHIAARIISICDIYDALLQRRSYKAGYPPDLVHGIMMRERGTGLDPELLDKFYSLIGVWPVGFILELDNGDIAVVREQSPDDIFLPKVEVILPAEKKRLVDLRESNGAIKIKRFIDPWKEGKDILALV